MRRLKEGRGFAPLPSAKEFNHLAAGEKRKVLAASLGELRGLGIHYDFAPVIDALPGDAFNPLWRQILIHFNPGVTPHQFVSEDEIDDAVLAGEITLEETDEVYRCSVVGAK